MTRKSKKILKYSLSSLLCVLILLCVFWPKLFVFYLNNVQKTEYLDVRPNIRTYVKQPAKTNTFHNLGLISADLSIENIKKTKFSENLFIKFEYNEFYIQILPWQNLKGKEELYFSNYCEIIKTTTDDIKILNSIRTNLTVFTNLILKSIMLTSSQIEIIDTNDLKIISQLSTKYNKILLTIYAPNNNYSQSIFIGSKDPRIDLKSKYALFINLIKPTSIRNNFNKTMEPLLLLQKSISGH